MAISFVGLCTPWESLAANGTTVSVTLPAYTTGDHAVVVIGYLASGTVTPPSGWTEVGTQQNENLIYYRTFWRILPTTQSGTTTENFTVPTSASGTGFSRGAVHRGVATTGVTVAYYDNNSSTAGYITPVMTSVGWYMNFAFIFGTATSVGTFTTVSGTLTSTNTQRSFENFMSTTYRSASSTIDATAVSSAVVQGNYTTGRSSNTYAFYLPVAGVADTTAPAVAISTPTASATISGSSVSVTGTATDAVGVSRVEIWVNGSNLANASLGSGTFSYTLNSTAFANGSTTIEAKAYDAAGNTSTASRTVTINNVVVSNPSTMYIKGNFGPIDKLTYGTHVLDKLYQGDTLVWSSTGGSSGGSSSVLRQSEMPSMSSAWTFASVTSSVTTSAALATTLIPITDSRLTLIGAGSGTDPIVAVSSGYYRAPFTGDQNGADPRIMPPWGFRIRTDATSIEVPIRARMDFPGAGNTNHSKRQSIRIRVNGQWSEDFSYIRADGTLGMEQDPPEFNSGTVRYIKIDLAAGTKNVEFQGICELSGVRVNSGATVSQAPAVQHTIALIGESLGAGLNHMSGQYNGTSPQGNVAYATYTGLTSYFNFIAQSLGYDNWFNAASSGSGFARNGDSVPFNNATRIADVIARNPQCVIVGSPGNDINNGVSPSTMASSCNTVLTTLRAALPNAILIVLGLGTNEAQLSGATAADTALRNSAATNGAWYISPYYGGQIYNTSGTLATTLTPTDMSIYTSSDGQHPSQQGAREIGKAVSAFVKYTHPV